MKVAAIDCGTNSIRLLIARVDGRTKHDVVRETRIVRLGEGVDTTGRLSDEAIGRTVDATLEFASLISEHRPERVAFCATSATRDAANAAEFSDSIESILGVRPVVLSGQQEAAASFEGATRDLGTERSMVIDLGGGSTEVVIGQGEQIDFSHSYDIGSVRMTERFLHDDPPTQAQVEALQSYLDDAFGELAELDVSPRVVGVAGTLTTIAAFVLDLDRYDSERIHAAELDFDAVRERCELLVSMSVAQRRALPFMHPGRADVIGAGAIIIERIIRHANLSTSTLHISEADILDGIAWALSRGDL